MIPTFPIQNFETLWSNIQTTESTSPSFESFICEVEDQLDQGLITEDEAFKLLEDFNMT